MKMLEYEYDPELILDNTRIDNQKEYSEFLNSIREEVVKRGSVRIFIPGSKYNSISMAGGSPLNRRYGIQMAYLKPRRARAP